MAHITFSQIAAAMRRDNNHVDMRFPTQVHLAIEHYMKEPSPRSRGRTASRSTGRAGRSASSSRSRSASSSRSPGRRSRRFRSASASASASASPKHTMSSVEDLYKALVASSKTQSSGFLGHDANAEGVEREVRAGAGPGRFTRQLYNTIHEAF